MLPSTDNGQVAVNRTSPNGLVLGIDVIPAQPPAGVSTIQGNFLSPTVQDEVKKYLRAAQQDKQRHQFSSVEPKNGSSTEVEVDPSSQSYLEQGKQSSVLAPEPSGIGREGNPNMGDIRTGVEDRMVDVVLSDMSAPWEQTEGFWKRSLSNPYYRMMNTSGINFRDHAGSMVCHEIQVKVVIFTSFRIYVKRPWPLLSIPSALVATSSANIIKALKKRHLRID